MANIVFTDGRYYSIIFRKFQKLLIFFHLFLSVVFFALRGEFLAIGEFAVVFAKSSCQRRASTRGFRLAGAGEFAVDNAVVALINFFNVARAIGLVLVDDAVFAGWNSPCFRAVFHANFGGVGRIGESAQDVNSAGNLPIMLRLGFFEPLQKIHRPRIDINFNHSRPCSLRNLRVSSGPIILDFRLRIFSILRVQ